ncbi:sugar ABC transporter ATP-binding protein [Jannaschia aquimarina]|uniref:AraG protein n=1 Tax=Jannaschia aquimarina TaxID=935700 RepID=A0A0D1EIG6_9RHOB|nr:sugar ABC transporter ATP-binding protein [Jannaschia aquimarina]KIT15640.1 Arabinose import ATP-binding protein AraG [Jannaschia aquimarina]SNT03242.1 monosaccharide ABC transporter ATP-binding protein, CUT2 family [Jannaschia aquimarina]
MLDTKDAISSPQGQAARATPLLMASGVSKSFGKTQALRDASLILRPGEVVGLLGANGAGKSTLSRIVSGHIQPSGGEIAFDGEALRLASTRDALGRGIALVAQETSLAPDLSVLENIFLPSLATPGRLSYSAMRARAGEILAGLGHEHILPLHKEVRTLSAAQRQLVEIAKALSLDARLIIFDEPTASLSATEVDRLFDVMARLRDGGRALAFVSHRLEEVFAITDRVTIIREGVSVAEDVATSSLTQGDIIEHMVGRDIGAIYSARRPREAGETVLEVRSLRALPHVRDVSFSVRRGEILGLGGLVGAGRSEAVEAIWGLRPRQAGEILVRGKPAKLRKPVDAVRAGMGFVAEDRRAQNIVPDLSVRENMLIALMGQHRGFWRGYNRRADRMAALIADLGLPADRLDTSLLNYSGGMQQKIIIARWLLTEPDILILDEPTKGVDIGTRSSIYRLLQDAADAGLAVIVISSDFEELLGLAERVVVVSDGLTIADLPASRLTEEKLTLLAAPRTSTARNQALLQDLVQRHGGTAFWTLIDGEELICLATAGGRPGTELAPGEAARADETLIPAALAVRAETFTPEADGARQTLLTQMTDRRGHDLGWIGLTLPGDVDPPPVADVAARVHSLTRPEETE